MHTFLTLYRDVAVDTGRSLLRSGLALVALLICQVAVYVGGLLGAQLGFGGGLLMGLLFALASGWYLALVEIAIRGARRLTVRDLGEQLGSYIWDVMSVLFVFWIVGLLMVGVGPIGSLLFTTLATAMFNPAPELVYQSRTRSLELLTAAFRFMQQNWPEWLGLHAVGFGVALGLVALSRGTIDIAAGVEVLRLFGPFFGFVQAAGQALALADTDPIGVICGILLLVFAHAFMLARGHLYRRLSTTSRRGRAWQARVGA